MSVETVRSGFDTWASISQPSATHPRDTHYRLRSNEGFGYIWVRSPAPVGALVTKATLTLSAYGASSGSRNVIVHQIGESWKESKTNWNNRPATAGAGINKAIGTLADRDVVEIDVTSIVQLWAGGVPNYGFRLNTTATSMHAFRAFNSSAPPTLTVEWSDRPSVPSDLRPSEAAAGLAKPHLTFVYKDFGGNTELTSVQVQINPTDSFTSPAFDSGEVATQEAGLDLALTAYPGLAPNTTAYWRARSRDGEGLWSSWSDSVLMSYRPKPVVEITNMGAGEVYETSPPVIWTVTGVTGPRPARFRVMVFEADELTRWVHNSGELTSDETSYTIPFGVLRDGQEYRIEVRVWDGWIREATPGDPTYAHDSAMVTVAVDATVGPVDSLTVTQGGVTPKAELVWTRSTTPDKFVVYRDGAPIRELDPAEAFVSGTTYKYGSWGARPNFTHDWEVRAVVNNRQSGSNPVVSFAVPVEGIWLIDRDRGIEVTLWGDDEGDWSMPDDASVYTPIGGRTVRIVSGMRNLEGSLQGLLIEGFGKSFEEMEADLYRLKLRPMEPLQIVAADVSFLAMVGNVTIAPKPQTRDGQLVKAVSFDFWSLEDFPYTPKI